MHTKKKKKRSEINTLGLLFRVHATVMWLFLKTPSLLFLEFSPKPLMLILQRPMIHNLFAQTPASKGDPVSLTQGYTVLSAVSEAFG